MQQYVADAYFSSRMEENTIRAFIEYYRKFLTQAEDELIKLRLGEARGGCNMSIILWFLVYRISRLMM